MTLREFAQRYPSSADLDALAIVNQAEPDTVLEKGRRVKRIGPTD